MNINKLRGLSIFSRFDRRVAFRYFMNIGIGEGKVSSFRVQPGLTIDKAVEKLVGGKRSEQALRDSFRKILMSAGFDSGVIDLSRLEDAQVDFLNIVVIRNTGEQRPLSVLAARIGHPEDVFFLGDYKWHGPPIY